jgi:hypothetical protein
VLKGHNMLLMHYRITRWEKLTSHRSYINYYLSIQTLTTLDLGWNYIGNEGAKHLAHALQSNIVRQVFLPQSHIHCYALIQAPITLNLQSNGISAEGAQHVACGLQSNTVRQVFPPAITYSLSCFNIDTHHAESSGQRYRCWRSRAPNQWWK